MADSAHAASGGATSLADIAIKQEPSFPSISEISGPSEAATKRPGDAMDLDADEHAAKRVKTETNVEESFEDGLALLVQNALSNVEGLVDQFNDGQEALDSTAGLEHDLAGLDALLPDTFLPTHTFLSDPDKYLRKINMNALGNLAISILLILSKHPSDDTIKRLVDTDSEHRKYFTRLKHSYGRIREIYSEDRLISLDDADLSSTEITMIELANLTQLGCWLFDGDLESLRSAHDVFFRLLNASKVVLSPRVYELFLGIRTQIAISLLSSISADQDPKQVLSEALEQGLEQTLREQHSEGELSAADQTFLAAVQTRKAALEEDIGSEEGRAALQGKFPASDLLRSFAVQARTKLASAAHISEKYGISIPAEDIELENEAVTEDIANDEMDLDDLSSFFEKTASGLVQNALAGLTDVDDSAAQASETNDGQNASADTAQKSTSTTQPPNGKADFMTDYKELEALVAESTSNYVKTTLHGLSPIPYQPTVPPSTTESMAAQSQYLNNLHQNHPQHIPFYSVSQPQPESQAPSPATGENLPPNQSFPSAILYDKARQAALSKSTHNTRREGLHSTRRPWTQEEEKALMAGLDMVKGPHWSQILTLFGHNGTISDILKDRTQVQLKDKARNLKLFFLKTNSEMPYYLQAVTGELKTRAPTQAARKEAEERARLNSEEDQAKLRGIMALAGGLQDPPQAKPVISNVITPAQAAAQAASSGQQTSSPATASTVNKTPASAGTSTMTPLPAQAKPGIQATAHQGLPAVTQAPPRPQTTPMPAQSPRPLAQLPGQLPKAPLQPQTTSSAAQQTSIQTQSQAQSNRPAGAVSGSNGASSGPVHGQTNGSQQILPQQQQQQQQQPQQPSSAPATIQQPLAARPQPIQQAANGAPAAQQQASNGTIAPRSALQPSAVQQAASSAQQKLVQTTPQQPHQTTQQQASQPTQPATVGSSAAMPQQSPSSEQSQQPPQAQQQQQQSRLPNQRPATPAQQPTQSTQPLNQATQQPNQSSLQPNQGTVRPNQPAQQQQGPSVQQGSHSTLQHSPSTTQNPGPATQQSTPPTQPTNKAPELPQQEGKDAAGQNDNAAEAALIQGLQAVVAEATS